MRTILISYQTEALAMAHILYQAWFLSTVSNSYQADYSVVPTMV